MLIPPFFFIKGGFVFFYFRNTPEQFVFFELSFRGYYFVLHKRQVGLKEAWGTMSALIAFSHPWPSWKCQCLLQQITSREQHNSCVGMVAMESRVYRRPFWYNLPMVHLMAIKTQRVLVPLSQNKTLNVSILRNSTTCDSLVSPLPMPWPHSPLTTVALLISVRGP